MRNNSRQTISFNPNRLTKTRNSYVGKINEKITNFKKLEKTQKKLIDLNPESEYYKKALDFFCDDVEVAFNLTAVKFGYRPAYLENINTDDVEEFDESFSTTIPHAPHGTFITLEDFTEEESVKTNGELLGYNYPDCEGWFFLEYFFGKNKVYGEAIPKDYDINKVKTHFKNLKTLAKKIDNSISFRMEIEEKFSNDKILRTLDCNTLEDVINLKKYSLELMNYFWNHEFPRIENRFGQYIEDNSAEHLFETYLGKIRCIRELVRCLETNLTDQVYGKVKLSLFRKYKYIFDRSFCEMIEKEEFSQEIFDRFIEYINMSMTDEETFNSYMKEKYGKTTGGEEEDSDSDKEEEAVVKKFSLKKFIEEMEEKYGKTTVAEEEDSDSDKEEDDTFSPSSLKKFVEESKKDLNVLTFYVESAKLLQEATHTFNETIKIYQVLEEKKKIFYEAEEILEKEMKSSKPFQELEEMEKFNDTVQLHAKATKDFNDAVQRHAELISANLKNAKYSMTLKKAQLTF